MKARGTWTAKEVVIGSNRRAAGHGGAGLAGGRGARCQALAAGLLQALRTMVPEGLVVLWVMSIAQHS